MGKSTGQLTISWTIAGILAAVVAILLHAGPIQKAPGGEPSIAEIRSLVEQRYVTEIDDPDELRLGAINGLIGTLDPYSAYLPPAEAKSFEENTRGEFGGLGIVITLENGILTVIAPIDGTPAFKAGILPGDKILEVEGEPAEFETVDQAARRLRGEIGTPVTITVLHEGEEQAVEMTLTRARIPNRSIKWSTIIDPETGIGFIGISSFTRRTPDELKKALADLEEQGMKRLVIDLRNNPGGVLDSAVAVGDFFLDKGKKIVVTRGRDASQNADYRAHSTGTLPNFPVAILINRYSASASEILAGALQDHGRARLFGSRSYGKGSVQSVIPVGTARLKLTTAYYYTPKNRLIHRRPGATAEDEWGLHPDEEAPMAVRDVQALHLSYQQEDLTPNGEDRPEETEKKEESEEEENGAPLPEDKTLEAALEWLKEQPAAEKQ